DLTKAFAAALPLLTEQMAEHLEQQERSLAQLGDSIDHVSEVMPAVSQGASRLLVTTRWLLCLVALMVSLHAAYVVLGARLGPPCAGWRAHFFLGPAGGAGSYPAKLLFHSAKTGRKSARSPAGTLLFRGSGRLRGASGQRAPAGTGRPCVREPLPGERRRAG